MDLKEIGFECAEWIQLAQDGVIATPFEHVVNFLTG
jgi:hypothetical protein